LLPGDGGDQVAVGFAQSGPVRIAGLVARAVRLEGEPLRVILAVFRPQMTESMAAAHVPAAAESVPVEAVRRFRLAALGFSASAPNQARTSPLATRTMPPGPKSLLVRPSFSVSLPSPTKIHACSLEGEPAT